MFEIRSLREAARVTVARSASEATALLRGGGIDAVVSEIAGDAAGCALLTDIAGMPPEQAAPVYFYGSQAQASAFGPALGDCGARSVTASFAELLGALQRHEEHAIARAAITALRLSPGVVAVTEPGDGVEAIITFGTGRRVGLAAAALFRRPPNDLFRQRLAALSSARDRGRFDEAWLVVSPPRPDAVLEGLADQHSVQLRALDDLTLRPAP